MSDVLRSDAVNGRVVTPTSRSTGHKLCVKPRGAGWGRGGRVAHRSGTFAETVADVHRRGEE